MKLHNYQERIVSHIERHPNCILSVDMGLGKTAAVLAYIERAQPASVLIIAPKRVAETTWLQEAQKWGFKCADKMTIAAGTKAKREKALRDKSKPYKVISRDNLGDLAWSDRFDLLVIDELTTFKNVQAARTKQVLQIVANKIVGLTGTFLANGAIDIYGQVAAVGLVQKFCAGLNFFSWRAMNFHDALQGSGLQFQKWTLNKDVTVEKLLAPIRAQIFTLTAADYLTIPPVSSMWHKVELASETRRAYDDLQAFLGFELDGCNLTVSEGAAFAKLQTLCNGFIYDESGVAIRGKDSAKLDAVADFCDRCKAEGEKVLLFYAFREEAVWLKEMLDRRKIIAESVKKAGFLDRWNAGEIDVLFAHPASAGHGLNLQHGGRVIVWSSLTYNYELWAQANARLARQGQTRPVQIHYFASENTCEAAIWHGLQNKHKQQNEFLKLTKQ
ncbi:MAG: DEAD/DEAH box helicase [Bacteroidales bacterium]|nr:DEAD/DEAH box helicase [Bacteroidales bacterium]